MKGSVILSLSLDVLAIGVILIPDATFAPLSRNPKWVRNGKRICFLVLLLTGFLIDQYVSHPG
ncbi:MAG: hypothetical protein P4L36_13390 [Holophaga sp.]|nr:hypothetical protein [Holophaga sp.]